jgi:hypothetical protein
MTRPERTATESAIAASARMFVVTIGAALFSLLFILSYGYAIHDPRPHHVRIDVVVTTTAALEAVRSDVTAPASRRSSSRSGCSFPASSAVSASTCLGDGPACGCESALPPATRLSLRPSALSY